MPEQGISEAPQDARAAEPAVRFLELPAACGQVVGVAQLNAQKSLNALTLEMIRLLAARLRVWEEDARAVCVVLHGAGEKAFCAGGDIRSLYRAITEQPGKPANPDVLAFFSEEYRLDHHIHRYRKPLIVWAGGIVMGGGLGLMAGAGHRVVTETSRIAMPEITIGLFPDVGGSWFLRRMPGRMGLFVALTGATLNAHDAIVAHLADYHLGSGQLEELSQRLQSAPWQASCEDNRAVVSKILTELAGSSAAALPASILERHASTIETVCAGDALAEVVERIIELGTGGDAWLQHAGKTLAAGSPTTAALIWELRRRAASLSLAEVFRLELVVALQCCARPDLREGVRALLIDKDGKPRWTPGRLDEVSPVWLAEHFTEPDWPEGRHPLHDLS
jgi:enoyl-CoA hydratase/carnithine racemase